MSRKQAFKSGSVSVPRPGFTLVELLVVIAIIGVLVGLLLPAVQAAREAARRMQCSNNLKQFGLAIHNYHDQQGRFPPAGLSNIHPNTQRPHVGWIVRVLPQMEQQSLYDQLNFSIGIPNQVLASGLQAREHQIPMARCPSDDYPATFEGWVQANYTGSMGSQLSSGGSTACHFYNIHAETLPGGNATYGATNDPRRISGMFSYYGVMLSFRDVKDGTSNTIQVGETLPACHPTTHRRGWWWANSTGNCFATTIVPINEFTTCEWAKPHQITNPACTNPGIFAISQGFRSRHPGGAHFTMVDGSVTFLSETINHKTFQNLGGRSDGNVISEL